MLLIRLCTSSQKKWKLNFYHVSGWWKQVWSHRCKWEKESASSIIPTFGKGPKKTERGSKHLTFAFILARTWYYIRLERSDHKWLVLRPHPIKEVNFSADFLWPAIFIMNQMYFLNGQNRSSWRLGSFFWALWTLMTNVYLNLERGNEIRHKLDNSIRTKINLSLLMYCTKKKVADNLKVW